MRKPGWYEGLGHTVDDPPPPAPLPFPPRELAAHEGGWPMQSFHTTCDDADALGREVPPALTTSGCEPGSSTASEVGWPRLGSG